jgi:predicted alpha/beta superfamily hydrolase
MLAPMQVAAVGGKALYDAELDARELARLTVRYPRRRGAVGIRGDTAPLDWQRSAAPVRTEEDGDVSVFEVRVPTGKTVEVKLVREDGAWAFGRNLVLVGGDDVAMAPSFEAHGDRLEDWARVDTPSGEQWVRVWLPPSYEEQDHATYPVIYAQDGQALWSDGNDPYGLWELDRVLHQLVELGSMREVIVVSIATAERRIERLSPTPDPHHGGGEAPEHLRAMLEGIKPWADARYRTRPERESTALLGSSMGGLFSFWATWTRPDVFGMAMCLSSSFWWADRWMVQRVQEPWCPAPRPRVYLDSGAAKSSLEQDSNLRDGLHHTQAMARALIHHCYGRGHDLDVLSFAGLRHDPTSWSARVAVPLQLMFPRIT